MRILSSANGVVKPGRLVDHVRFAAEAAKLFEGLGAENPRLLAAMATGETPDGFVFSYEFASTEAWGRFGDDIATDGEYLSFIARTSGVDAPSTVTMVSTATEIPLREGNHQLGSVVEVHVSKPVDGRFEQALEEGRTVLELVENRGATNARCWRMGYAGVGSGLVMVSWEFENLAAFGRLSDQWTTDSEMMAISASQFSADRSTTGVFDGVYRAIQL